MNRIAKIFVAVLISLFILTSCMQKNPGPNNPPTLPQNIYPSQSELIYENTLNIEWTASQDPEGQAVTYAIRFAPTLNELEEALYENETANTTFPLENLASGTWFWQVKAGDPQGKTAESSVWNFTVNGDGLPQPENPGTIPPDSTLIVSDIQDTSFTLDWEPYKDPGEAANPIIYRIDLYEEGTQSPLRTLEKGYYFPRSNPTQTGQSTNTHYTFTGLINNTLYYWIILAMNNASQTTVVGSSRLKTGNQPPTVPELVNPEDQAIDVALTSTLDWTQSTDPNGDILHYYVFLDTLINSPRVVTPEGLTVTSYHPELTEGKTYYWRVLVKDDKGGAAISTLETFSTVKPNGLNYPTTPTPANNSLETDSSTHTTLSWEHEGTGDYTYSVWMGTDPKNMTLKTENYPNKTYTVPAYPKGEAWYYWQVQVTDTDSGESVTGPQWQFKTTAKGPPFRSGPKQTKPETSSSSPTTNPWQTRWGSTGNTSLKMSVQTPIEMLSKSMLWTLKKEPTIVFF